MAKNLVIVESPAKAKTIKKFLGANYEVVASGGHVRDLPKSTLGVDVDADYEPKYITIRGKGDVLAALRKEVKKAQKVYLATDPDREGEAISWHLMEVLKLDPKTTFRITFNEITKDAVKNSIKQARDIDMDLVNAQQARRVLDRMVGYEITPVLWEKLKKSKLSAGRVQSVTLRLLADREEQIAAFNKEEYWTVSAAFSLPNGKKLQAEYAGKNGSKPDLKNEEQTNLVLDALKKEKFFVSEKKSGERKKKAPLPFTTSTLQQEASRKLNMSTQATMRVAQQLYEGVDIKGHGTIGLITYLRTDSTRISEEADRNVRNYIREQYGEGYVSAGAPAASDGKKIQDAHEAIRPSYLELSPTMVKEDLSRDQLRLYTLIWKRFVASRMSDAVWETVSLKISGGEYLFTAAFSKLAFEGYRSVYSEDTEDKEQKLLFVPEQGTEFSDAEFAGEQHFTLPPARYTEASLVKTMEELGIGRPSTYAPTITTLLARHYITKEKKNLCVTELGEATDSLMKKGFPSIVEVDFTANMELLLDGIAEGNVLWKTVIRNFYPDLHEAVKKAQETLESVRILDEESDVVCELCGRTMVYKYGPHGKFLACPGFPACRNTKQIMEKAGVNCPKCGKELIIRRTRKGRRYYGCEGYPECDFMSWQKPEQA